MKKGRGAGGRGINKTIPISTPGNQLGVWRTWLGAGCSRAEYMIDNPVSRYVL